MPMIKNISGLDLGSHSLKVVEFRQGLRGLESVQTWVHERSMQETPLADALSYFLDHHDIATEYLVCALPGDQVSARRLDFPFRERKKLIQAIPFEIESQLPFDLDDILWQWQLASTSDRNHATVDTCVTPRKEVQALLNTLSEAGCQPRIIDVEGPALSNLAPLFGLKGTHLLADIGHRKTSFCLISEGATLQYRTIPVAGQALTEAIGSDGQMDLAAAETWKKQHGIQGEDAAAPFPNLLKQLDRIAREALRILETQPLLNQAANGSACEIVLMGGSAHLSGIEEYLSDRVGIPARKLELPEDSDKQSLLAGSDPLLFGPAIALAMHGTSKPGSQFNFRTDEFRYRGSYEWLRDPILRPATVMLGLAAILFAVSTSASIMVESRRADQLESQLDSVYGELFPGQPIPDRPVPALSQAVLNARDRADFLGLYGGNLSALDFLTLLSQHIPPDLSVKFEEISIDRNVIRIKILADNYEAQDRLENVLKTQPLFANADVAGSAKRLKDGSVSFGLTVPLAKDKDES